MTPWHTVRHLFDQDDGSLPDIFVENLSHDQIIAAYEWLLTQCRVPNGTTVWSKEKQQDVSIREFSCPAKALCDGRIEGFRHLLEGLSIGGVVLPEVTVCVAANELIFDYRMGSTWTERTVVALFERLRHLRTLAPSARIVHAYEGCYGSPNVVFSEAFEAYVASG